MRTPCLFAALHATKTSTGRFLVRLAWEYLRGKKYRYDKEPPDYCFFIEWLFMNL